MIVRFRKYCQFGTPFISDYLRFLFPKTGNGGLISDTYLLSLCTRFCPVGMKPISTYLYRLSPSVVSYYLSLFLAFCTLEKPLPLSISAKALSYTSSILAPLLSPLLLFLPFADSTHTQEGGTSFIEAGSRGFESSCGAFLLVLRREVGVRY